jgi:uncharacterized phage protein (TIGR01671 family)
MREIKFRAWHKYNESMIYFDNDRASKDQFQCSAMVRLMTGKDDTGYLMQYTGLKADGVEIYEGDIVKCWGWGILGWVVYWDEESAQFCLTQDENFHPTLKEFIRGDRSKVIGNIYENPELENNNEPV